MPRGIYKRIITFAMKKANRERMLGKHHSKETKEKISQKLRGDKSSTWKGGKISELGYVLIYKPEHPFCDHEEYVREHRLIMEKHLRRYLKPEEHIHHINGVRNDNRIENLILTDNATHAKIHSKKDKLKCSVCGKFMAYKSLCCPHRN